MTVHEILYILLLFHDETLTIFQTDNVDCQEPLYHNS